MRVWAHFAAAFVAFTAIGAPQWALAQSPAGVVQVDARAEVAAALYAASATQAAAERAADARLRAQASEIDRLRREGRASRTQIAELEERYVADLAQRDRAYAQEIAVFRAAVEDIASTPEGLAILAQRRPGNLRQARAALLELIERRNAAEARATAVRKAANLRTGAAIALDDRNMGEATTEEVIALYEQVTQLDPVIFWDWVQLARMHRDKGDLPAARQAADHALEVGRENNDWYIAAGEVGDILVASGDLNGASRVFVDVLAHLQHLAAADPSSANLQHDVAIGQERLGDVLLAQGNLTGALAAYRQREHIIQRLAAEDPSSASLQRDVSVGLDRLGGVLFALGDLASARTRYLESLDIRRLLAAADPSSASMQRDVAWGHLKVGGVMAAEGDLAGALLHHQESLRIQERLIAVDPNSASLQRDAAVSQSEIGDVLFARGDLTGALARHQQSLYISQRLAAADPTNAITQRLVMLNLSRVGQVQVAQGDVLAARPNFERSLALSQRLAAEDPSDARLQRDVWASMQLIVVHLPGTSVTWSDLVAYMEDMQRRGVLAPNDVQWLEQARANAAQERAR